MNISTLKSTTTKNTTYMTGTASLHRVGALVFFTYSSDFKNVPTGSFSFTNFIPSGYRPFDTAITGERDGGKITLRFYPDGSVNCYNYGSASSVMNAQFSLCWITTDPLPN